MNHPPGTTSSPSRCTAFSVMIVFGADVPAGKPSSCCIFGFAKQSLCGHGNEFGLCVVSKYRPQTSCISDVDASPGRVVAMSVSERMAFGLLCDACSHCGVR